MKTLEKRKISFFYWSTVFLLFLMGLFLNSSGQPSVIKTSFTKVAHQELASEGFIAWVKLQHPVKIPEEPSPISENEKDDKENDNVDERPGSSDYFNNFSPLVINDIFDIKSEESAVKHFKEYFQLRHSVCLFVLHHSWKSFLL